MNRMKPLIAVAVILLSGCSMNARRDVENVPAQDADSYELWNNLDGHPNMVRVCIDGTAWLTTERDFAPVTRVPEWDENCPS